MKAESDKMGNEKGVSITEMIRTRTVCATVPRHAFEVNNNNLDVVCLVVKGVFIKAMEDEVKMVRQEVCRTLQRLVVKYREDIVTKSAVSLLGDALADPAKEVRQSAVVALTKVSSHYTPATMGSVGRLRKKRKLDERVRKASSDSDRRIYGMCREPLCWLTDVQLCQLLSLSRDKTFVRFKIVLKCNPRTTHLAFNSLDLVFCCPFGTKFRMGDGHMVDWKAFGDVCEAAVTIKLVGKQQVWTVAHFIMETACILDHLHARDAEG
jgi:hypothetical protein